MAPEDSEPACAAAGLVPAVYAKWRASELGALTERLERKLILGLLGDVEGAATSKDAGAIYYPRCAALSRLLAPADETLGRWGTPGAAFLALSAIKPE